MDKLGPDSQQPNEVVVGRVNSQVIEGEKTFVEFMGDQLRLSMLPAPSSAPQEPRLAGHDGIPTLQDAEHCPLPEPLEAQTASARCHVLPSTKRPRSRTQKKRVR
jgi:hypothetical protein